MYIVTHLSIHSHTNLCLCRKIDLTHAGYCYLCSVLGTIEKLYTYPLQGGFITIIVYACNMYMLGYMHNIEENSWSHMDLVYIACTLLKHGPLYCLSAALAHVINLFFYKMEKYKNVASLIMLNN